VLDCLVGIEAKPPCGILDEAHREPKTLGPLLGFFQLAAHQPAVQPGQFRFAHGASES